MVGADGALGLEVKVDEMLVELDVVTGVADASAITRGVDAPEAVAEVSKHSPNVASTK